MGNPTPLDNRDLWSPKRKKRWRYKGVKGEIDVRPPRFRCRTLADFTPEEILALEAKLKTWIGRIRESHDF